MERTRRHFKRALVLNCRNGWVERHLLAAELIDTAVGIDYSDELLAQARQAAQGLPLTYVQMDENTATFPHDSSDLVVNYSGSHHMARLDPVFRCCAIFFLRRRGWSRMTTWSAPQPVDY